MKKTGGNTGETPQKGGNMWDERFSDDEYIYGEAPNDFLLQMQPHLPKGRVLCLAEGEGRNAVYLAQLGYEVSAVDSSAVGLKKCRRLAENKGVEVHTILADLQEYTIEPGAWDGIVAIFCHLPKPLQRRVYPAASAALRPGGALILEGYTPKQLEYGTGGPPTADFMLTLEELRQDFSNLHLIHGQELERDIREGTYHFGPGHVVQIVAKKRTV